MGLVFFLCFLCFFLEFRWWEVGLGRSGTSGEVLGRLKVFRKTVKNVKSVNKTPKTLYFTASFCFCYVFYGFSVAKKRKKRNENS